MREEEIEREKEFKKKLEASRKEPIREYSPYEISPITDFKEIDLIPGEQELKLIPSNDELRKMPEKGSLHSSHNYLDIQFRLLLEDC